MGLNTMSKKLAFSDTLTHEQYSSNPKQFRPYMSSEQSQLISRIESDIVDIVKTAPPKSFWIFCTSAICSFLVASCCCTRMASPLVTPQLSGQDMAGQKGRPLAGFMPM